MTKTSMTKDKEMKKTREVRFIRGHNCKDFECINDRKTCYQGSGGFHGVHGLDIAFYVKGEEGAVQFKFSTGYIPFIVKKDSINYIEMPKYNHDFYPMPTDLGYHSKVPRYEGQTSMGHCDLIGCECYYDGSGLNASDAFATLVNAGEEELWRFLEEYYDCVFFDKPYPEVGEYPKKERSQ